MISSVLFCGLCLAAIAADGPAVEPVASEWIRPEASARIDAAVQQALEERRMPGCVVLAIWRDQIIFRKAYGNRAIQPQTEAMTVDTIFDLASLTKPIATATSVMILVEQGRVRLRDRVKDHISEFGNKGKEEITLLHLLTHQGGLIADNPLGDYEGNPEESFRKICELDLVAEPGERFIYSDVGFIVLGEVIRRVTGKNVHEFSQQHIFEPLGMKDTGFLPPESKKERCAVTQEREGRWMRGEVHDPRSYRLRGIAGHAGLFSTADDLSQYARMMLRKGWRGSSILSPATVRVMSTPHSIGKTLRGLGWDMNSSYSVNRGELLTDQAFGHSGFTGTGIWIDPGLDLAIIFLSARVHPDGKGLVNPLVGRIGSIVAASVTSLQQPGFPATPSELESTSPAPSPAAAPVSSVQTGIDVLKAENFVLLKGRKVGLITNHTGRDREGQSTIDVLAAAPDVKLVALFSPEHGIRGALDVSKIADGKDEKTGLPIYSLYGERRKPTDESLKGIDTLVFDIQDVGARFYTYVSTMRNAMESAAKLGIRFVVLDRPNPINGVDVEGPVLDAGRESFIAYHTVPVRHGMTVGELAMLVNRERQIGADLHVVKAQGWRRADYFDATDLEWINPSPNMRSLTEALLYPGIGLLETTNLSVGRGTDTPFEVVGAPWLDGRRLAEMLNQQGLAGVRFVPVRFTPTSSKFRDQQCGGVNILIVDRARFVSVRTGLAIAVALRQLHPMDWETKGYDRLLGNRQVLEGVEQGKSVGAIEEGYRAELDKFLERRRSALLYE